jgi:oligosaccharyltransferase complex subunit epsilon
MAPKRNARESTPAAATAAAPSPQKPKSSSSTGSGSMTIGGVSFDKIVVNTINYYKEETPQRTVLIDVFMGFLAVVGALQFLYCILAGNYVCWSLPFCEPCPFTDCKVSHSTLFCPDLVPQLVNSF